MASCTETNVSSPAANGASPLMMKYGDTEAGSAGRLIRTLSSTPAATELMLLICSTQKEQNELDMLSVYTTGAQHMDDAVEDRKPVDRNKLNKQKTGKGA